MAQDGDVSSRADARERFDAKGAPRVFRQRAQWQLWAQTGSAVSS
jgi:hypothetical protein